VKGKPGTPSRKADARDLRRAISRQTWLTNRARNALRRPAFIGAISVGTFVTALVSMVITPRVRPAPQAITIAPRPDTLSIIGNAALGRIKLAQSDTMLTAARSTQALATARADSIQRADTLSATQASRDSLRAQIARLDALIARAEQAPLPSSYKALAATAELRTDPRIRALLDSLTDVEREREGFGAVGGVDPIFVALTSRASEIGRSIQSIAAAHRSQLQSRIGAETPAPQVVVAAPVIDTASIVATRDSIQLALIQAEQELVTRRARARQLDLDEERARERATAVAPPLALLAAAFVLSAVVGFAVAFFGELRRPRVGDATELERFLGLRVLATVETAMPSVDRGRRQADRSAPPYFDPGAEGYQLAYLGLATEHPSLLSTTVTGDDPAIAAVVACNLAAVAADEARNTLVVDLEPTCRASAALRSRLEPGISDLLSTRSSWPDVTIAAPVGRDKAVDLVPCGLGQQADPAAVLELFRRDAARIARYYDAIFVVATPPMVSAGVPAALPSPDVIFCAQPGLTPLRKLKAELESIRDAGGDIRGIVLWSAERPLLPTSRALSTRAAKAKPPAPASREVEVAAS
jgi:hypothetical protein